MRMFDSNFNLTMKLKYPLDEKTWLTDENKTVPEKCPVCGADMGLFLIGEPVFLCKSADRHYYGTLKFPAESED